MKLLRGWFGEKITTFNMWLGLDTEIYKRFHNVIISSNNGTSQIDHILVSAFGVFIVETKNMKGWIFGSENQPKWTQTLYNKKYPFQNPVRQTYRQKKVLSEFLGLDESIIHTVIYFVGDCEFKTPLPNNVINTGLRRYLKSFQRPILSPNEVNRVTGALKQHKSNSLLTRKLHIRSLRNRHASTTICPNCGSNLVERIATKGSNIGSKFLGCEGYPKCRFTKDV